MKKININYSELRKAFTKKDRLTVSIIEVFSFLFAVGGGLFCIIELVNANNLNDTGLYLFLALIGAVAGHLLGNRIAKKFPLILLNFKRRKSVMGPALIIGCCCLFPAFANYLNRTHPVSETTCNYYYITG